MKSYLFEEFEGISANSWKQKIQVDLKGADYNETLLWTTDEGITVKPFYTKEDRTQINIETPKTGFSICQTILITSEKEANEKAINSLERGANSIEFIANTKFDYKETLKNIPSSCKVYFNLTFFDIDFINKINTFKSSKNFYYNIDIIGNLATTGNWYKNLKEDFETLKSGINTDNIICVNNSIYQNSGANIAQQLAYTLAHANEYLNFFGSDIANKIHFNFSVGSNYFFEIAKIRAFRILWSSLLKEYNINHNAHIFVKPSLRNKTLYDYNVNMLRTTSESMSGILGGANTISNSAYDHIFHNANEFGDRIARNQLLILKEESYFSEAQNIANGSYYIDAITQQLAEKALEIFKLIEQAGGFLKQLKDGVIQRKITESATKEQEKFDSGDLVLLGTNKIQNAKDKMKHELHKDPFVKKRNVKTLIQPIIQKRLAEKLEQERLKNEGDE